MIKPTKPTRRVIATDQYTAELYEKVAKAINKQPDTHQFVYIKSVARRAIVEFVEAHPELGIKL